MLAPNWEDEETYSYTRNYNLHSWAWEFLRRNPDYRRDFAEIAAQADGLPDVPETPEHVERLNNISRLRKQIAKRWWIGVPSDPKAAAHEVMVIWARAAGVGLLYSWDAPEPAPGIFGPAFRMSFCISLSATPLSR